MADKAGQNRGFNAPLRSLLFPPGLGVLEADRPGRFGCDYTFKQSKISISR
jgi:hypothetical protein